MILLESMDCHIRIVNPRMSLATVDVNALKVAPAICEVTLNGQFLGKGNSQFNVVDLRTIRTALSLDADWFLFEHVVNQV